MSERHGYGTPVSGGEIQKWFERTAGQPWPGDEYSALLLRRMRACVNACQGLSTEALESGALKELRDEIRIRERQIEGPVWRALAKLEGK